MTYTEYKNILVSMGVKLRQGNMEKLKEKFNLPEAFDHISVVLPNNYYVKISTLSEVERIHRSLSIYIFECVDAVLPMTAEEFNDINIRDDDGIMNKINNIFDRMNIIYTIIYTLIYNPEYTGNVAVINRYGGPQTND